MLKYIEETPGFAKKYWTYFCPFCRSLSIDFELKSNLSKLVYLDLNTIGVRIPNHNFPLKIVEKLKKPIITTSVNVHNQKSLNSFKEIKNKFKDIDIISVTEIEDCIGFLNINFKNMKEKNWDVSIMEILSGDLNFREYDRVLSSEA